MSSQMTAADVPLLIISPASSSERRVSPSWTISQFKTRLEPITGIPAESQRLSLRLGPQGARPIESTDEDNTRLDSFALQPYAELDVHDTRPPSARTNFNDVSSVPKYTMPAAEYESRTDSVLAWKKAQKLGRFDPAAPSLEEQKLQALEREVEERGIAPSKRCRLLPSTTDDRRGTVSYVGLVPEIPGAGIWVGITLDEPTGKNDGSIGGKRYFSCNSNCGVFVRPERVEIGDFPVLNELEEDMEEM